MASEDNDSIDESPATEGGTSGEQNPPPIEATLIQGAAAIGPKVSGVTLESTIGTGGQGTVFLGRQEYLNRRVAVKVLHRAADPKLADRFRREATILAGLHHPNIVACYSAGVSESEECFMVMEYIDGPDLHDYVSDNGPVDLGLALELVSDLAHALAHGLEASIIHRDIKPQNVLLQAGSTQTGRELQAKLTDLGLARFTDDQGEGFEMTAQGAVLGTPLTMAPEQSDDPDSVDYRTDIYGLGCVLYWALTGKRAFSAKSMAALYRVKTSGEGLRRIQKDGDLPDLVKPLLLTMLAAEPADRPQSYEELIEALDRVSSGVEPEIGPRKRTEVSVSAPRGLRWAAAAGGVATLAAAAWLMGGEDAPGSAEISAVGGAQGLVRGQPLQSEATGVGGGGSTPEAPTEAPAAAGDPLVGERGDAGGSPRLAGSDASPVAEDLPAEPEEPITEPAIVFARSLEVDESRELFDPEVLLAGWDVLDPDWWLPSTLPPDVEESKEVPGVINQHGVRLSASRPAPSGDWSLTGEMLVGPMVVAGLWSASVELLATTGEVLRLDLLYYAKGRDGESDPVAESTIYWAGQDLANPREGATLISTGEPVIMESYLVKARSKFTVTQLGDSIEAGMEGHEKFVLTPPGGALTFAAVRLVCDSGKAHWRELKFTRSE